MGPPPEHTNMFFTIYFAMTGLHGIHVLFGIVVFIWLLIRAIKGHFTPGLLRTGRLRRAVLAHRRPDLDLPVPAALPDPLRPPWHTARSRITTTTITGSSHVASIKVLLGDRRHAARAHARHGARDQDRLRREHQPRDRDGDRGDQGDARHPVLHAPASTTGCSTRSSSSSAILAASLFVGFTLMDSGQYQQTNIWNPDAPPAAPFGPRPTSG